jgi:hypothetical protein
MTTYNNRLESICRALAGSLFRAGLPLHRAVAIMWDEYDRLFGLSLMGEEERERRISSVIPPESQATPNTTTSDVENPPQDDIDGRTPLPQTEV